jgi:hypothetical protein
VQLTELPGGHSKHRKIVSEILDDVSELDVYASIKVDLLQVGEKKGELRGALHRAAKKRNMTLSTTSENRYLYVFPQGQGIRTCSARENAKATTVNAPIQRMGQAVDGIDRFWKAG